MKQLQTPQLYRKLSPYGGFFDFQGWYSYREFSEILKKEQNRSDRNGIHFSYVQINIEQKSWQVFITDEEYMTFFRHFAKVIDENTQSFDIKFFKENSFIGLLLIDTTLNDARDFIETTCATLYKHFEKINEPDFLDLLKDITISTYPVKKIFSDNNEESIPFHLRSLKFVTKDAAKKVTEKAKGLDRNEFNIVWSTPLISTRDLLSLKQNTILHEINTRHKNLVYDLLKRLLDIFGALLVIMLTLPIMIIIAIAIKLNSKGPVLFKQERVGELCKTFKMYKFRTMWTDCDENIHRQHQEKLISGEITVPGGSMGNKVIFKVPDDPRITPVGYLLRRTNLDELPQLFNILFGQMSVVGPRPPIPYEVNHYNPWHLRRVLEAKPGLTGLWQASRTAETSFADMIRYDLYYINHQSVIFDFKIILKTIVYLFTTRYEG